MNAQPTMTSAARFVAFRLLPGDDLLAGLDAHVIDQGIKAGWVAGVVGSLSQASLRFAGEPGSTQLTGAFEIIALSGMLDAEGGHFHLSIADARGMMRGGHVMPGCIVRTTCELVVGDLDSVVFQRKPCSLSGYSELVISSRKPR